MVKKNIFKEYIEPLAIAVIIALFIRTFVVAAFKIPSESMKPTLLVGDHILVNKFIYGVRIPYSDKLFGESKKFIQWKTPKRGDVIVFIYPQDRSKDFIKRVIGTEGDKIDIVGEKVYINDKVMEDPWGVYRDQNTWERILSQRGKYEHVDKVPKGHLFVMGDNRDNSQDSRFWGFVDLNDVKGKAFIIYYSGPDFWELWQFWRWNEIQWGRFGKLIH